MHIIRGGKDLKTLDLLLENFWITRYENEEVYYKVKDEVNQIKDFLKEKLRI
jgi:negative regulator of genetic competence, sporulation and motility